MTWLFPWVLLFFFLFFCGIFILVFYYTKTQDKALQDILFQQRAVRMELDRLATALDALLADRPLTEDENDERPASAGEAVPGLDRLLLGPAADGSVAKARPGRPAPSATQTPSTLADGLPSLKL